MPYPHPKVTPKIISHEWHLIDAKGEILGRMATRIATLLMGKHKPYYVSYLDTGDFVVVINSKEVLLTGRKEKQKEYLRYSGFPGGLKRESLRSLRARRPEEIVRRAVLGMLPKNKLARQMIKKLYIYPSSEHPYEDKFKNQN